MTKCQPEVSTQKAKTTTAGDACSRLPSSYMIGFLQEVKTATTKQSCSSTTKHVKRNAQHLSVNPKCQPKRRKSWTPRLLRYPAHTQHYWVYSPLGYPADAFQHDVLCSARGHHAFWGRALFDSLNLLYSISRSRFRLLGWHFGLTLQLHRSNIYTPSCMTTNTCQPELSTQKAPQEAFWWPIFWVGGSWMSSSSGSSSWGPFQEKPAATSYHTSAVHVLLIGVRYYGV